MGTVKIKCNGGIREAGIIANFGSFKVWYDDKGIAIILFLKTVKAKNSITYEEHSAYILNMWQSNSRNIQMADIMQQWMTLREL